MTHIRYPRKPLHNNSLLDHLDTLLRHLKDNDCAKVVVTKPCGPGFEAMVKAQRQNGTLPDKLTGMIVHPQAIQPTQKPYPFMAIVPHASQDTVTLQSTSTEASGASAGVSQTPTTAADPNTKISRNSSGQRVDPRIDAFAWLVADARKQKICYEYRLHGHCTWGPTPCPNAHGTSVLNVHQLNALQVLARELPCDKGNSCPNWKCCFGHRCPFGQRCRKGQRCQFSRQMHVADLRVLS